VRGGGGSTARDGGRRGLWPPLRTGTAPRPRGGGRRGPWPPLRTGMATRPEVALGAGSGRHCAPAWLHVPRWCSAGGRTAPRLCSARGSHYRTGRAQRLEVTHDTGPGRRCALARLPGPEVVLGAKRLAQPGRARVPRACSAQRNSGPRGSTGGSVGPSSPTVSKESAFA